VRGSEWEAVLIKNHMSLDDEAVCREIKVVIAFVIGRVIQKDTSGGPRGELMGCGGGDVRITCTTEDVEVLVRGCGAKENDMRVGNTDRLRGETVQQIHDGVEPLSPIAPGK
jgi:hypothetical protein